MPFDLTSVMNQVQAEASAQPSGDGSGFQYKLFYPGQVGTVAVKLLFNPATNLVGRVVYNHKVGKVNVPCMRTWDADCPICNALSAIDNVTGRGKSGDRSGGSPMRSTRRGISYAQLVESSYPIENIQVGDIMLLMYPQTVYNDINRILSQARTPDQFQELVAQNEGKVFEITHGKDNRYSTAVDLYRTFKTCNSDEEFESLLNGMDPLTDQYRPAAPTEEIMNTVMKTAKDLEAQYLGGNVNQPQFVNPNPAQQQVFTPYMGQPSAQTPATPAAPATPPPAPAVPPQPQASPQVSNTPPWNASANFSGDPDIPFSSAPSAPAPAAPTGGPARQMGFQVPTTTARPSAPAPRGQAAPAAAPPAPATAPAPQQPAPAYTEVGADHPVCYGMHGDPSVNPETCSLCGSEVMCNFATIEAQGR